MQHGQKAFTQAAKHKQRSTGLRDIETATLMSLWWQLKESAGRQVAEKVANKRW